jgi:hypothetical protein
MVKQSFSGTACDKVLKHLGAIAEVIYDIDLDEESQNDGDRVRIRTKNNNLLLSWNSIAENQVPLWRLIDHAES